MKRNDSKKYTVSSEEFSKMSFEEKIMTMTEGFETPSTKSEDEVLDAIFNNAENRKPVKVIRLNHYIQAIAAVALLVIGFYTVTAVFAKERVRTQFAEQTEVKLPDGTQVILNADSKMTWSDKNFMKARQLKLNGEAYFHVKKGSRFLIETQNGNVEILGTQLNVFSRKDEFWVSCITGKVKVTSNGQEQIITPGELVKLSASKLEKTSKNNIDQTISWQQGMFYFEDTRLVSIFDAVERQFDVSVKYEGNKNRRMTVAFTDKSLQEALDIICIPMGLKYEINNKKVKISESPE